MAILRCKICGGSLNIQEHQSIAVCEYCKTKQTLPKLDDQKRIELYERANGYRRNNEYDKAAGIYEMILSEDETDAEAYWSLVLCRFGVEYVEEPATHKMVPTCNRTQSQSILVDENYKAVVRYAIGQAKVMYQEEAAKINEIQKSILSISLQEDPYDLFICYKENDEHGRRTRDSVYAQEIYNQLINEGYRVFFSRISLEDKVGSAYEPYIFAALNSAKIMLVVGTKADYFNAVWVKNEWSRFLALMQEHKEKQLIPIYKDMDPYDMPEEFSHLQAQDMNKLGFMQDIVRGINKILEKSSVYEKARKGSEKGSHENGKEPVMHKGLETSFGAVSLEKLLHNSQTYLKLGNYEMAEEVYTTVTKECPEDYRGWWGVLVCKTHNFSKIMLDQSALNILFGYIKQLSEPEAFEEFEKIYVEYTRENSALDAVDDIISVEAKIRNYKDAIESINKQIDSTQNEKMVRKQSFRLQVKKDDKLIEEQKQIISEREKDLDIERGKLIFSITSIALGVGLIIIGIGINGWISILGACLGCIGLYVYDGTPKYVSEIKREIASAQNYIINIRKQEMTYREQYDVDIENYNLSIEHHQNNIEDFKSKILNCQKYIKLGRDRIATFGFAERCSQFGVKQSVDQKVLEYRKAVFEINE